MKNKNIHNTLQKLNVSNLVKCYFNSLEFDEIIDSPLVTSTKLLKIDESIENLWSFSVDLKYCTEDDILIFYESIINARKANLVKNNINEKMIFYTWYDELSGCFYFSSIPVGWKNLKPGQVLPFDCLIHKAEILQKIVSNFSTDQYRGKIPMGELKLLEQSDSFDDNTVFKNHGLDFWSIIL